MVVRRTIDNLKERPHHERRAVALMIAIGVVVMLFLGWAFLFFSSLRASQASAAQTAGHAVTSSPQEQVVVPSTYTNSGQVSQSPTQQ